MLVEKLARQVASLIHVRRHVHAARIIEQMLLLLVKLRLALHELQLPLIDLADLQGLLNTVQYVCVDLRVVLVLVVVRLSM